MNENDYDSPTPTRDTRSNSKAYIHIPPRVDQEYYQVELPYVYHGPIPIDDVGMNWWQGTHEIHSTDHEDVKKNFLLFTRNIYERAYHSNLLWTNNLMSSPLHTDEHALEFLSLHNYELNKAKFFLCALLSGGKEIQHVRKIRNRLDQIQSGNKLTEKLQILFYDNESKYIHGFYSSDESTRRTYMIEGVGHIDEAEVIPEQPTISPPPPPQSGSSSSRKNKKKSAEIPQAEPERDDEELPEASNEKHRSKADKQDRKKKWLAIHKTFTNLQNAMNPGPGYSRPTFSSLHEAMELAYRNLPTPSDILLGDAVEENLQQVFQILLEKYLSSKEWIAKVYDVFSRTLTAPIDFKKLQSLLNEGERLSFRCVLEETQLRRSLRELESILEESELLTERIQQQTAAGTSKVVFSELNDLLMALKPYGPNSTILPPQDMKTFQDLYDRTVQLNDSTEFVIHRAAMPRIKRARLTRVTVEELNELLLEISAHPITVYGSEDIKAIRDVGANWQTEASRVCADGAPLVSMTKLETLINSGEKLPLDFPEELEILRNKRTQAKQWLEKFGKSVAATTSSRHTRKSEGKAANGGLPLMNVSLGEKINLEDMKKMVQQGEQLCDDRKSKELTRAINVLDTAEEWIDRVKEFLQNGVDADIESLQELLDETEGMPVAMVEADLLRSHIEALQWAEKAKPLLEKDKMKLSSLQRLSRDIQKIRAMISPEYAEQYAVTLPEETKLNEILSSYQKWQDAVKRLFQGGFLKSGATLKTLQLLVQDCHNLQVDLEQESKQIRSIVAEATEWVESFGDVLIAMQIPITSIVVAQRDELESKQEIIVGYSDLKNLIDSANQLTVEFPELIAARKRWSDVQEWLDQVDSKCPKRHGKRSKHSNMSVQTSELIDLVNTGQKLYVSFPDELKRLQEVIERSMNWELTCESNISEILTLVQTVVNSCRDGLANLPQLLIKFNFLIGTNQQIDYNQFQDLGEISEEEVRMFFQLPAYHPGAAVVEAPWDFVEKQLVPMLDILIQGVEEAGSITSQGLLIIACQKAFNWIIQVKSKLTSLDWGNASRSEVLALVNEARIAVPLERSKNDFDQFYENSILSSSAPSHLSEEEKIEEAVMLDQYSTPSRKDKRGRKKESKPDDISEVDSKDGVEDMQLEDLENSGRKKRKGGRKRFGDEDIVSVDEPKSGKKRSRGTTEEASVKKKARQSKGESISEHHEDQRESDDTSPVFFDKSNPHTDSLPPSVVMLIDMWIRWLILFLKRIDEIEIWKNHSYQIITNSFSSRKSGTTKTPKKMHTRDHNSMNSSASKDWSSIILKPDDEPSVVKLLDWAKQRNLSCSTRKLIERRYQNSLDWSNKVHKILTVKSCRVPLEDTQLILKESEDSLLFSYQDLIASLKENIKRAKAWTHKLEKSVEGSGNGPSLVPITTKELEDILPETENICIDLTPQINNILQHTKVYCLCREASHGMMLGCEKCEDWCHITCFGFTKAQADRIDAYVCFRCSIIMSFNAVFTQLSSIVNCWMSPEDAVATLENRRQKLLKRIHKEEKDILKLKEELCSVTQSKLMQKHQVELILSNMSAASQESATQSTLSTDTSSSLTTSSTNDQPAVVQPTMTPNLLNQLPLDTGVIINNLEKKEKSLRAEIESLESKLNRVRDEEEELLSFFALSVQQRYQLNDWMVTIQSLLWPKSKEEEDAGRPLPNSLPLGVISAIEYANQCGLDKVHDVRVIRDGFIWMTWCYQCLTVLRLPPTSRQLRKLLDFAASCKMADDKIVKVLSGISMRASQWKTKARKFLGVQAKGHQYSTKSIDVAKAKTLLIEGNMTPLRSRLKDILRESITNIESGYTKEGNSGRRKAALESVVGLGVNNLSSQNSTFTLDESPPYSSEEEDNSDITSVSSTAKRDYAPYSSLHMAAPVDNLWPPKQAIPKSLFRPYNPSYRHVFLTAQPREEVVTTSDPSAVTAINDALKKKRKLTETEQIQPTRSVPVEPSTKSLPKTSSPPQTTQQPGTKVLQQPPTRTAQVPRQPYTFPRPMSFPPGAVLRGGILYPPPGAGRSFVLPLRPPFIPSLTSVEPISSSSTEPESEQTPPNSEHSNETS